MLLIIYIAKPMLCHSPQCYHCFFKLKNKEEKLGRKKIAPFMIWSKHDKNNSVTPYIFDRTSQTDTKLFLGLRLFYQYEFFRSMLKGGSVEFDAIIRFVL